MRLVRYFFSSLVAITITIGAVSSRAWANPVEVLYFDGVWHHTDVTGASGAPFADEGSPGSPLATLMDTVYRTPDVFFLSGQHVHILFFNGAWNTFDVSAGAGAPYSLPGSPLAALMDTIYSTPDVFYLEQTRHVHILYFDGALHHTDLTAASGAPFADTGSPLAALLDTVYRTPDVFYLSGQHVHILFFNGAWNTFDVTAGAGGPNAAAGSPLAALMDTVYGTPDVFYLGADQHVHILYFDGALHHTDLTAAAGAPNADSGSSLAALLDTVNGTPDVFYLGADQHVHILYFDGAWNTLDVTAAAGAPNADSGSSLAALLDTVYSIPEVFYLGADDHVHALYFNGAWNSFDVTAAAGAPNAVPGSPLAALTDTVYGTPDLFYMFPPPP